ncbi:hypothetical protein M426DRAFT_221919 [Hypoxylon sp. CI-4A]|nr:hypothetical protein M426DRAFT_221919 [Hypoxylon sp. CI-4A]
MSSKSILVTGCSSGGIGAAVAFAMVKRDHHVFVTARNTSKIPQDLSSSPNVTVIQLDVSSATSVAEAAKVVTESGRGLDVLFNNAGAGYAMPILDVDIERAQQVYDINVWGPIRTVQAFSKLLIESKGRIVNLSTCGAAVNTPWIASYCSSKAALTSISETLRLELAPFGVSVVTIMAGAVASHFHDNDPFHLPPASYYTPIEQTIGGWASGELKPKGCSAEQFAEMLVEDIVGAGKNGMVWKGPYADGIKFLSKWGPRAMAVST